MMREYSISAKHVAVANGDQTNGLNSVEEVFSASALQTVNLISCRHDAHL